MKSIELIRAVMEVLTEVWDRSKQIDDADEVLGLIEALQSQDREDAERYRWLREQCQKPVGGLTIATAGTWELGPWSGDDPDEAIDRARRIEGEP